MAIKKTRKKTKVKVSRKIKKNRAYVAKGELMCERLKEVWDNKKTMLENFNSIDLKTLYEDRFPEKIPDRRHEDKINEWERSVLEKLVAKHADDITAMSRDIKINKWQWTAAQLKKKVKLFNDKKFRSAQSELVSGRALDWRHTIRLKDNKRNIFGH